MSDFNGETPPQPGITAGVLTAGAMLRAAREAAGLHVAALAVSMKVPVKKLEALEADRLDLLPDAVFVRALASSVCRALRIDAAPVLDKLPQTTVPRLDAEERGINAPFHTPGEQGRTSMGDVMGRPSVLLVLVLMVGALVLAFFPESRSSVETAEVAVPVQSVVSTAVPAPMVIPSAVVSSEPVAEVKSAAVSSPSLSASASASASTQLTPPVVTALGTVTPAGVAASVSKPAALASSVPVASSAAPPKSGASASQTAGAVNTGPDVAGSTGGMIAFSVKGPSWVEVTDAKGVVQLRKTLLAGETASASGALPLSVVVGRIDATEVTVRGKPFSLAGISKDNVARFEVK